MNGVFTRQHYTGRILLAALGIGAVLTSGVWAQPAADAGPAEAFGASLPARPDKALKPALPTPSERLGVELGAVPSVRLAPLDRDALLEQDAVRGRIGAVKALRYGIGREVAVASVDGQWYDLAGGARLWAAEIVSTDALGVRLRFKDLRLPQGAELAVYSPSASDPENGLIKTGSPRFDPERYVQRYGASSAPQGEVWTGTFVGDRVRMEYLAPAGSSRDLPFTVDNLQHLYLDPVDKVARGLVGDKVAGNCHNDVSCFPEWADLARAVSGIGFIGGGDSLFCTGQLLNAQKPDFTPYWLTANHCLETNGEANSAEFYWFYQTSSCNGAPPSLSSSPRSLGASLLATSTASDFTLLLINGALPDGVFWSGWTTAAIPNGAPIVAIHHPAGDYKRISFGQKADSSACLASRPSTNTTRIDWTDAPTEPGSSGSGVFLQSTGQLFGQLFFGPSACGNETFDCYGTFSVTYPRIKNLLQKGGSDDNSEQNDTCAKAKNTRAGRLTGRVVKALDSDWYKITVPKGKTLTVRAEFSHNNGDIDLAGYGACNKEALATSTGSGDEEVIQVQNTGNKNAVFFVQVYLDSDTRNEYNLTTSFQ
jgi:lysyl endopeptidase